MTQIFNAMEIGGRYFKDVTRASFEDFARRCDVNPKAVLSRLDALSGRLPRRARELRARMSDEGHSSPVYGAILSVIERHIAQVYRSIAEHPYGTQILKYHCK